MRYCGRQKNGKALLLTDDEIINNALKQEKSGIKPHYAFYDYKNHEKVTPAGWLVWSLRDGGCGVVYRRKDGKMKIEYNPDSDNVIEWENSLITVLVHRGYADPIEYLNRQNDAEEIRANLTACINLFKGVLICADYLLKHPEEKRKERHARSHSGNNPNDKSSQKRADSVQVISLNSLRFKTANKKVANMLKSKKVHRMTESWSVRGHYRHYKSGKVIFIESFEKGKNRKQASQKKNKI